MSEQNPFEDFQPSWLKAKPAAPLPVSSNTSGRDAEDILLQEVITPLRPSQLNSFEAAASAKVVPTPPAFGPAISNDYTNVAPVYNAPVTPPLPVPDTLPPSLENLRARAVKTRSEKAGTKSSNWLFWLLAIVGVLVLGGLIYAILVASQGEERQRNSQPAIDVGEMPRFPDAYLINLNVNEIRPFEAKASLALTKMSQQACFRSSSNLLTVQQFYENQLPAKKFTPQGMVGEGVPQTEAWRSASGNAGVVMAAISVGYLDFSLFNRAEPGQTIFCLFNGQSVSSDLPVTPGGTPKAGPTASSPVDAPAPNPPSNNENPPTSKPILATAAAVTQVAVPNTPVPVTNTPPVTPTPVNPLDQGS